MKKNKKTLIGILVSLILLLLVGFILVIILVKKEYTGTWYMTEIYEDEKIITTFSIKRDKTVQIKTEYTSKNRITIDKGKWKKSEKGDSIILSFNYEDDDWNFILYIKNRNTLCMSQKDCAENQKLHKKEIINWKEYYYVQDDKYYPSVYEEEENDNTPIIPEMTKEADYSFDYNYDALEDKDKVIIYVFYGQGCPHCQHLFESLDALDKEIKDMIVVKMYETWFNSSNRRYMEKVANYIGDDADGVPYIIIGNKTWIGFTDAYLQEMIDMIKQKPKLDIEKEMEKEV